MRVVVQRPGDGQVAGILLEGGSRSHQADFLPLTSRNGLSKNPDAAQPQVSIVGPTGSAMRQAWIGQRLQSQRSQHRARALPGEGVGVVVGVLALGQEGSVGHRLEVGAALGLPVRGLQQFPVGRGLRCGPGFQPRLEASREHRLLIPGEFGLISGMLGLECGLASLGLLRIQVELPLASDGRGEGGQQSVVIPSGNGVELVVMAPGTSDGQTEHGGSRGGQHVVHRVVAGSLHLVGRDLRREHSGSEKPRGH